MNQQQVQVFNKAGDIESWLKALSERVRIFRDERVVEHLPNPEVVLEELTYVLSYLHEANRPLEKALVVGFPAENETWTEPMRRAGITLYPSAEGEEQ